MDSVEMEFYREVAERKNLARAAYGRVNGSKSKRRARMPSDYLTEKQRKELSGEVMSYNFNEKITWEAFKGWPHDIQQEYTDWFIDRWGLGPTYMARMFGVSLSTVTKFFANAEIHFRPKIKATMTDRMAFEGWLRGAQEPQEEPKAMPQEPAVTMKCGSLEFEGNMAAILESVYKIIGDGTGKIRVDWSVEP